MTTMTRPFRARAMRGFTLIELMVVLVIIGVLAALIVPNVLERADDARVTAARTDVNNLVQALKLYRLDNQRYPTAEQGLQALVAKPTTGPIWALRRATARSMRSFSMRAPTRYGRGGLPSTDTSAMPPPCGALAAGATTPTSLKRLDSSGAAATAGPVGTAALPNSRVRSPRKGAAPLTGKV